MTISRLRAIFPSTSLIKINPIYSGYNSSIIENAARTIQTPPTTQISTNVTSRIVMALPPIPRVTQPIMVDSAIFTPTPGATPGVSRVVPISTSTPTADISDQVTLTPSSGPPALAPRSTPSEDEIEFFGSSPTTSEVSFIRNANDESHSGPELTDQEKPKIVSITSANIINGRPTKVFVFIKKLISPDKKAIKYILKKRDLFNSTTFINVAELTETQLTPASRYPDIVNLENPSSENLSAIVDSEFTYNNVYVYKLYVEWLPKTEQEKRAFLNNQAEISEDFSGAFRIS